MNVTLSYTTNYENKLHIRAPKKQSQFKANYSQKNAKTNPTCRGVAYGEAGSNPTCRGVAYGEAGSNPTCSELACPACPACPERSRRGRTYLRGKKMLLRMTNNTRRKSLGHYADWRFFAADHGPNLSCFVGLLFAQGLIFSKKNSNYQKSPIKPGPVFVDLYIRKSLHLFQRQWIISADFGLKIENNRYSKEVQK